MTKKSKFDLKNAILKSKKALEKESEQWKKIIGEVVWIHLEIENAMLSTIIDLQKISLGSKERKEVEELSFLGAAKTCFLMGYLDNELYEEIKAFNTTRNNIVHKIFKKPEKTENPLLIKKALLEGKKIAGKIYDAHFSLEEDKARELLGGKSEWGGPILYGDAKQKLKQLEGYGGELIEKMREEIRKEIEEEEKKNSL